MNYDFFFHDTDFLFTLLLGTPFLGLSRLGGSLLIKKENLLMLDNMGEWFGRSRPVVFGKEGAKRAEERGASTLAGILHSNDDDSFGADNEDDFKDGWVIYVPELRREATLC